MKKIIIFSTFLTLLILLNAYLPNSFAQDPSLFSLPEGAKARLGKGWINNLQYSSDGTRLAVATSIGVWLYDTQTYQEVALLTEHTRGVNSVAFGSETSLGGEANGSGTLTHLHSRLSLPEHLR